MSGTIREDENFGKSGCPSSIIEADTGNLTEKYSKLSISTEWIEKPLNSKETVEFSISDATNDTSGF